MTTAILEQEVQRFLRSPKPEALCIRGKWGTGKTYAWNKYLQRSASGKDIGLKRYSYNSLFGINTLQSLKACIVENTVLGDRIGSPPSLETFSDIISAVEVGTRKYGG